MKCAVGGGAAFEAALDALGRLVELGGGAMTLSDDDITSIVAQYVKNLPDDSAADDPVSDGARLLAIAYCLPGARVIAPERPPRRLRQQESVAAQLIRDIAERLHAINSSLSFEDWRRLYEAILSCRYAGTRGRIRALPKQSRAQDDACVLSLAQWQEKYEKSRSHYYALRKEAVRLRQAKAKKGPREK